jgi:hypothetical protein
VEKEAIVKSRSDIDREICSQEKKVDRGRLGQDVTLQCCTKCGIGLWSECLVLGRGPSRKISATPTMGSHSCVGILVASVKPTTIDCAIESRFGCRGCWGEKVHPQKISVMNNNEEGLVIVIL